MEGLPGWWISSMSRPPPRQHESVIMTAKWFSGILWAWSFSIIVSQVRKYPEKPHPGNLSRLHGRLARWRKWRACDVGETKEGLENELWRKWSDGKVGEWAELIVIVIAELILQPVFSYVTVHSPTLLSLYLRYNSLSKLPLLHLRHSSFSNPSFASPTSQALHLRHLASRPCPTGDRTRARCEIGARAFPQCKTLTPHQDFQPKWLWVRFL